MLLLLQYGVLLVLILILEVAAGILAAAYKDQVRLRLVASRGALRGQGRRSPRCTPPARKERGW